MVQLNIGETLRVQARFTYVGPAFAGYKCRVAIGNRNVLGFDEILYKETPALSVVNTPTPTVYTIIESYVNIPITAAIAAGFYELYAKLIDIPGADLYWYGTLDDIEILAAEGQFSNLMVTYSKF